MEDLIRDIQERTGLPADTVLEVVTMVTDYMRRVLPDDLIEQITSHLGVAAETAGTATEAARATTARAAGVAVGTAGAATEAARATTARAAGVAASSASGLVDTATGMASAALSMAKDTISTVSPNEASDDPSDD